MSKEEKHKLIEECRGSGMSAKAWCASKGIDYRSYVGWATRYNRVAKAKPTDKQRWVALELPKDATPAIEPPEIHLECGRWKISVGDGTSLQLLMNVLRAVSAVC